MPRCRGGLVDVRHPMDLETKSLADGSDFLLKILMPSHIVSKPQTVKLVGLWNCVMPNAFLKGRATLVKNYRFIQRYLNKLIQAQRSCVRWQGPSRVAGRSFREHFPSRDKALQGMAYESKCEKARPRIWDGSENRPLVMRIPDSFPDRCAASLRDVYKNAVRVYQSEVAHGGSTDG